MTRHRAYATRTGFSEQRQRYQVSFVERWAGGLASVRRRLEQCDGEMTSSSSGPNRSSGGGGFGWPLRSAVEGLPGYPVPGPRRQAGDGPPFPAPPESARRLVLLRHGRAVDNFTGRKEGLTAEQAREQHPHEYAVWLTGVDVRRGGGETRREGESERQRVCWSLSSVPAGGTLVAVTHGGTARAAVGLLLELPDDCWTRQVSFGNACWSTLVEADLGWRLEQHNILPTAA